MNWAQLLKNAVITAIGAPIVYWVIVQVLGGAESTSLQTYIIIAIASVVGGAIGEALRQKSER